MDKGTILSSIIHSHTLPPLNPQRKAGSCMSGNVHVRLREKAALLYLTLVFNGVCSFFFGRVCQYDLNEVRGFASDIRWASSFCANPSGRRLVVGGHAELSEEKKGSLVCKHSNEPRTTWWR